MLKSSMANFGGVWTHCVRFHLILAYCFQSSCCLSSPVSDGDVIESVGRLLEESEITIRKRIQEHELKKTRDVVLNDCFDFSFRL